MSLGEELVSCLRDATDAVDELILGIKASPRAAHPSCLCNRDDDTSPIGVALLPFSIFLSKGSVPCNSDKVATELDAYTERLESFAIEVSRDLGDSYCSHATELQSAISKACLCLRGILIQNNPADASALQTLNQALDNTYTTWTKAIEERPSSTPVTKEDLEKATDKVTDVVVTEAAKQNRTLGTLKNGISYLQGLFGRLIDTIAKWFPNGKPKGTWGDFKKAVSPRYVGTETIKEEIRRKQVMYIIDYSYEHPLTYHAPGRDKSKLFRPSDEKTLYTAAQACITEHPEWATDKTGYHSTQALLLGCQALEKRKKNPVRFHYAS